ncbi:MAG: right-handed parallel beta-helix repeat-containing protein [bacterium]|nr:right-handed parallel beta-helix repeat-containing protein [bacterium]
MNQIREEMIMLKEKLTLLTIACMSIITMQTTSKAQIHISGALSGVLTNETYIVDDSIYVQAEDSLVIEPGSSLLFNGFFNFGIYGYLYAVGTETDSIYFQPAPGQDSLRTIVFQTGSSGSSTLSYCYITGCAQSAINAYYTPITITHCTITNNTASWGGGIYCSHADATISDCVITNNICGNNGGGIYCTGCNPIITNCIVNGNLCNTQPTTSSGMGGGGICANHSSSPTITGCTVNGNHSLWHGGGISMNDNSHPVISYCLIADNSCDSSGGGIAIFTNCLPLIANCTIVRDTTDFMGGAIYMLASTPTIKNTIMADCIGEGAVYFDNSPLAVLRYNDFSNPQIQTFAGTVPDSLGTINTVNLNGDSCDVFSNLYMPPEFVDPNQGNYHIDNQSPCVDAGDPTSPFDPDGTIADQGVFFVFHVEDPPEIVLSTYSLDFDTVLVGESSLLTLTVHNLGVLPLTVRSITSNLSAFATDFTPADSVVFSWDSLVVTVSFVPEDSIVYDGILSIENNDDLVEVPLHGVGANPNAVTPERGQIPNSFAVSPPYPNPFNPSTVIRFTLPVAAQVQLQVFDLSGRVVGVGLDPTRLQGARSAPLQAWYSVGTHEMTFDGSGLGSGVYIYRLQAGGFCASGKMVLLK